MNIRYRVTLTESERQSLTALTRTSKTDSRKFIHARALLLCDAGPHAEHAPWTMDQIAAAFGISDRTVEQIKKRFVEEGMEAALERKPRSIPRPVTFDGAFQARLLAIACSQPPDGRARWTVRLLAEKVVELQIAPEVSHMTVARILKKTNCALI